MAGSFVQLSVSVTNELQEARVKDDDWTGKTDPAERRKRQNRLHQRAWRRRKAQHTTAQAVLSPASQREANYPTVQLLVQTLRQLVLDHVSGRQRMPITFDLPQSRFAFWATLETLGEPQSTFAYWAELKAQRKREITSNLLLMHPSHAPHFRALQNHDSPTDQENCERLIRAQSPYLTSNIPHVQCISNHEFPLPIDHQLLTLIQHNVLRGMMTNMSILLHLNGCPFEGWLEFYTEDLPTPPDNAPPSLQPTQLQKTTSHESWIDILPYPALRDNVLRNQNNFDADALCDDFLGGMYDGLGEVQSPGIILWGEPWAEDGWEMSESFARKWSFLLKGCNDLIEFTNKWREARGEERLVVEV